MEAAEISYLQHFRIAFKKMAFTLIVFVPLLLCAYGVYWFLGGPSVEPDIPIYPGSQDVKRSSEVREDPLGGVTLERVTFVTPAKYEQVRLFYDEVLSNGEWHQDSICCPNAYLTNRQTIHNTRHYRLYLSIEPSANGLIHVSF